MCVFLIPAYTTQYNAASHHYLEQGLAGCVASKGSLHWTPWCATVTTASGSNSPHSPLSRDQLLAGVVLCYSFCGLFLLGNCCVQLVVGWRGVLLVGGGTCCRRVNAAGVPLTRAPTLTATALLGVDVSMVVYRLRLLAGGALLARGCTREQTPWTPLGVLLPRGWLFLMHTYADRVQVYNPLGSCHSLLLPACLLTTLLG